MFVAEELGQFIPFIKKSVSDLLQSQQALNGETKACRTPQITPIGIAIKSRTMSHIIPHSNLQMASPRLMGEFYSDAQSRRESGKNCLM